MIRRYERQSVQRYSLTKLRFRVSILFHPAVVRESYPRYILPFYWRHVYRVNAETNEKIKIRIRATHIYSIVSRRNYVFFNFYAQSCSGQNILCRHILSPLSHQQKIVTVKSMNFQVFIVQFLLFRIITPNSGNLLAFIDLYHFRLYSHTEIIINVEIIRHRQKITFKAFSAAFCVSVVYENKLTLQLLLRFLLINERWATKFSFASFRSSAREIEKNQRIKEQEFIRAGILRSQDEQKCSQFFNKVENSFEKFAPILMV